MENISGAKLFFSGEMKVFSAMLMDFLGDEEYFGC